MKSSDCFSIPGMTVARLQPCHIAGILALMNKEGWYYYDECELQRYIELGQDCFTLLQADTVIGCIFSTNYGDQAWLGNIIVTPEQRGRGLAAAMLQGTMRYLQEVKGVPVFRLGSVPLAIGLYKKMGFHAEAFTSAQEAELPLCIPDEDICLAENVAVSMMVPSDLEAVSKLDAKFFGSNRHALLRDLRKHSLKNGCLCLKAQGAVAGFIMARRRQASKKEGGFAEGPDYAYRLGPSCVLPEYGVAGFKALFKESIKAVNADAQNQDGSAKLYAVFPINADREKIYRDTRELAAGMDMQVDLDWVFDEHDHIFAAEGLAKNGELWEYMKQCGFHQEYFEQVMSCVPGEIVENQPGRSSAGATQADPAGIFAAATPGDKA